MDDRNYLAALAEKLSKTKYHYVHKRVRSPLYQYFLFEGVSIYHNKAITFPYPISVIHIDGDLAFVDSEFEILKKLTIEALEKDGKFMLKLLNDAYKINTEVEAFARQLEGVDFSTVTKEKMVEYWKFYVETLYCFGSFVVIPLFIEEYMENTLREQIAGHFGEAERAGVFQVLTTPMKASVIQDEEGSLLKLAISKQSGADISVVLKEHVRNFSWIKNNKFNGVFYTEAETVARVEKLAQENPEEKYVEYQNKIKETREKFDTYKAAFVNKNDVIELIDTLQESIYFRSWRTERYYRNAYFLQGFFKKTSEALGLENANDLFYLTSKEILSALLGEKSLLPSKKISERRIGYFVFSDTKNILVLSGSDADIFRKSVSVNPVESKTEIKGQVAFPGKVTGKAHIITSMADLHLVQEGEILVTTSTTPDYVPVLKKVRAIVTEEGGVLSHASVISRELHIPCIIGTKIATKVLKDGDMIEVDAEKGIVRILV